MPDKDLHLMLGEIKGKLDLVIDNQNAHGEKIDKIHGRMNKVERSTAINAATVGSIAAVGISFIRHKLGI